MFVHGHCKKYVDEPLEKVGLSPNILLTTIVLLYYGSCKHEVSAPPVISLGYLLAPEQ